MSQNQEQTDYQPKRDARDLRCCISLEELNKIVKEIKLQYPEADEFEVDYNTHYSTIQLTLTFNRNETNKERDYRLKSEEIRKENILKYERIQYEALKKKFEG